MVKLAYMFFLAAETIILGFQNYIMMLGTSVMIPSLLVPAMGGSDVSLYSITRKCPDFVFWFDREAYLKHLDSKGMQSLNLLGLNDHTCMILQAKIPISYTYDFFEFHGLLFWISSSKTNCSLKFLSKFMSFKYGPESFGGH